MPVNQMDDHDLLITAVTKLETLIASVADLKESLSQKADLERVRTLEERCERLEECVDNTNKKLYYISGLMGALGATAGHFLPFFK